ncbi:MAG: PRC-barrel domain-containing protein [Hyphomicrobium sp.]|uniref:PRC-barrel domain-containing protein n=1 Tax=Hyphomicrobium sp. TaxID=82 RepID=UPI0039E30BD8
MMFSKWRFVSGLAFVAVLACAWSLQTRPVASQEQEQQQAPAAEGTEAPSDQAAPAAEPSPDGSTAAPAAEPAPESGTTEAPPAGDAAAPPADNGGAADVAPAQPEQPAAEAPPAAAPAEGGGAISASQVQIGAAVFGADGAKIGEINGIKADDAGHIQEILVTDGVPAGINAKVFEITADKITSVTDGVKLSLSAEEAKKLPIIDNSNG